MKKFIKFIKEEQEKLEPTKKKFVSKKKSIRHPEMPDDSVSEITDHEKEEVMAKYDEAKAALRKAGATLVEAEWPTDNGESVNVLAKA